MSKIKIYIGIDVKKYCQVHYIVITHKYIQLLVIRISGIRSRCFGDVWFVGNSIYFKEFGS